MDMAKEKFSFHFEHIVIGPGGRDRMYKEEIYISDCAQDDIWFAGELAYSFHVSSSERHTSTL